MGQLRITPRDLINQWKLVKATADALALPFYVPEWERYCEIVRLEGKTLPADEPNQRVMSRVIGGGVSEADGYLGTSGKIAVEVKYLDGEKPNSPVINVSKYKSIVESIPMHMGFNFTWNHSGWNHMIVLKARGKDPIELPPARMYGGCPANKEAQVDDKKMVYHLDRLPRIQIDI